MTDRFKLHAGRQQASLDQTPFHTWLTPQGKAWTEFFRLNEAYLLRFPGLADFYVDRISLEIQCYPDPGVSADTVEHLFLNHVKPLVLSKQGKLVFHASVVAINGVAVAFLGESGRGKSTLAASLALAGYPFLADDGLVVETDGDRFLAIPNHPSIRLWGDSEQVLLASKTEAVLPVSYTPKGRFLANDSLQYCQTAMPLGLVYFLGEVSTQTPVITHIKPSDGLIEWVKHSFLLDIEEKPRLASHFDQVAALARNDFHYRLEFPRKFEQLDEVLDTIIRHVESNTL